jgi:pyruvate formate lyase activating enzyme
LVLPEKFQETYDENMVFTYINKYKHLLDAVSITGGEPTLQPDLPEFISEIKQLGLKVKLDTNGSNLKMLQYLINSNLIDFLAMDVKHLLNLDKYNKAAGFVINNSIFKNILNSIELIENSGIAYEFRTTVAKGLHSLDNINFLKQRFEKKYRVNNFNPEVVLNTNCNFTPFTETELTNIFQ